MTILNILNLFKKKFSWPWVITIFCVLFVCFAGYKSCRPSPGVAYWQGQYDLLSAQNKVQKKALDAIILKQTVTISQLEISIDKTIKLVDEKKKKIDDLGTKISEMESTQVDTVANLKLQIDAWKQRFSLAESVIKDKDAIIFDLTAKYESQVRISDSWKALYTGELNKAAAANGLIMSLKSDLRIAKFTKYVAEAAVVVLTGVVIWNSLKQ